MKTAISIPDQIFKQADVLANELGITRSELYSKAIEEYIKERDDEIITEKLNEIYDTENNNLSKDLIKMQLDSIKKSKNKW